MGDRGDFTALVQARLVGWRRTAYLICGDWNRAEDLLQVALVRMYTKWHRIEPSGLDAYARKVITRLAIDESRRPYFRSEISTDPPDLASRTADPDTALDIRRGLAGLTPKHRAVIVLRFFADLTVTETAAALGISEGTVKSQTSRALAGLRTALGADHYLTDKETTP